MKHKKSASLNQGETPDLLLSSLLLGKSPKTTGLDVELDSLFKSSAGVALPRSPEPARSSTKSNPKPNAIAGVEVDSRKVLKRKGTEPTGPADSIPKKRRKSLDVDGLTHEPDASVRAETKKRRKSLAIVSNPDSAKGHVQDDLEEGYFPRSNNKATAKDVNEQSPPASYDGGSSNEDEESTPQHESLAAKTPNKTDRGPKKRAKYVPPEETKERRDERTMFIGNLPTEVAKSKPARRNLQRLITSSVPGCKIESTRFRSVAFQNPTSDLPKLGDESTSSKPEKASSFTSGNHDELSGWQSRQLGRAARWREQGDIESERPTNTKTFLTPAEKKRVAFIKGELHSDAAAVHAYIVFAYEEPGRSKNVPPVMNPFEAAKKAVEVCDGMLFMDRTIRVDRVRTGDGATGNHGPGHLDPRRTIFVGGLDFQTKEEELRALFEKLLSSEVGTGGDGSDDGKSGSGSGDENKDSTDKTAAHSSWVSHVRLIRDKETQLGKGIAYVEFKERSALDEIMALDQAKLKLNKRKIRVERCKSVTSLAASKSLLHPAVGERASKLDNNIQRAARNKEPASRSSVARIPKGDPALGDRLRGLDKAARHAAKAADPSRQARRLAKKKARHALERTGAVLGKTKPRGKPKLKAKVSRARSAKSAAKLNVKK